nr:RNA-directed DNA polymerase, eukaryota, reverse transcriptase zinc-binding domain protein [Tanacetum cinerariifolium]
MYYLYDRFSGNEGVNVEARKENYGNTGAMIEKRGWVQQQRKEGVENLEKSKDYRYMRNVGRNNGVSRQKIEFRPKVNQKANVETITKVGQSRGGNDETIGTQSKPKSPKSVWKLNNENMESLKRSANKFVIFKEIEDSEIHEVQERNMKDVVDKYVNYQRQPTMEETKNRSKKMCKYFKEKWNEKWNKEDNEYDENEDVYEMVSEIAKSMAANVLEGGKGFVEWFPMTDTNNDLRITAWNVRGMCNSTTQKEVRNFIAEEKLSICAVLETHVKEKQINKICTFVYGRWNIMSNMNESKRGCRIIVGWNLDDVNVMKIHTSNQAMLCLIETMDTKEKFFCCFTYAASFGKERRNLWKDISVYKGIVDNHPWVLMGDWNEARLPTLFTEVENLKMLDNGIIDEYAAKLSDEYAAKLSGIASKSATLEEVMSEHNLVKKFLTSLPRRFVHIVAALEQVLYLKTTGLEDVVGRLKAYEESVKEEDKVNDAQENLLYARTEYSNRNNDSRGERGRGSYSRGRGRSRDNSQNQGQRDSLKNREDNK